jgi:Leucine-rich repeat (LRR) protein
MNLKTLSLSILLMLTLVHAARAAIRPQQDRVIAEVTRLGGSVVLDETLPGKPIVKIDLHGTQITDSDLAFLDDQKKNLKQLQVLDLRLTKIGDQGISSLRNLNSIQTLNLFRTQLSDKGLAHLRKLTRLQTLLIGGTKVSDAGLINLKRFSQLKKLSLFQTQISDAGIPHLKVLAKLETLLISGSKITPAGAGELQRALPRLRFSENT